MRWRQSIDKYCEAVKEDIYTGETETKGQSEPKREGSAGWTTGKSGKKGVGSATGG